jgi:hypothetical protein
MLHGAFTQLLNMNKVIKNASFLWVLCWCFACVNAQALFNEDSVDIYIARLNWNSFGENGQYFSQLVLGQDAKRLIRLKSSSTIEKLIQHLTDSTKTVVIHQILTQLLDGSNWSFSEGYSTGNNSPFPIAYTYNGLTWLRDSLWRPVITPDEIKKIEQYWRERDYPEKIQVNITVDGDPPNLHLHR